MKSLRDQIVLLTGAGGGFGRILARLLAAEGCRLILADRPGIELPPPGGAVLGHAQADLAEPDGAAALYAAAAAVSPRVDMLVNNAGLGLSGRIDELPPEAWERLMQVNLLAPMRLTALALPQMLERRSGHIVNISSVAGLVGAAGLSAYSASKFGLRGFGAALARDVGRHGVDVTTLYPFFSRTPILESPQYGRGPRRRLPTWLATDPERVMAELVRGIRRRRRHVYPDPYARLVGWLIG